MCLKTTAYSVDSLPIIKKLSRHKILDKSFEVSKNFFEKRCERIASGVSGLSYQAPRAKLCLRISLYKKSSYLTLSNFLRMIECEFKPLSQKVAVALFNYYCNQETRVIDLEKFIERILPCGYSYEDSVIDYPQTCFDITERFVSPQEKRKKVLFDIKRKLRERNITLSQIFIEFDQDGNGLLTKKEFLTALRGKYGMGIGYKPTLAKIFDECDIKKHGQVNYGQFAQYFGFDTDAPKMLPVFYRGTVRKKRIVKRRPQTVKWRPTPYLSKPYATTESALVTHSHPFRL